MRNPQPQPKYGRCRVCDRPLGKDGECYLFPHHSQISRPDLRVVSDDAKAKPGVETMESTEQLTLSEELFDRYAVEAVKVSVSGTIEIPLEMLEQMTAGLEPGDTVAFTCRGHVADVSTPYRVKDHSHDGRLVLRAEVLHGVEVLRA